MQEAFSELESGWYKQVNIQDLRFTSRVSQDLGQYKSKTCQTVILAKEQQATSGDIVFWYIADPSKIPNSKCYSGKVSYIDIFGYKKWLWNKIKILLANTFYFSHDELGILEGQLLHSSSSVSFSAKC
jgi:hypothetical protein